MKETRHPCGALPVRGWSISLWWCDHHQAFWASLTAYEQAGDDEVTLTHHQAQEFGPFDAVADVERWLQGGWAALRPHLPRPGMPSDAPA